MIEQIKLYLFILSIVYSLRFIVEFSLKFFQESPEPIKIDNINRVFLYLTISYIITYFLI